MVDEDKVSMGLRDNKGKPGVHLIPMDVLLEVAKVYDFGSIKYAPRNWERGLSWEETRASLLRHMILWSLGQDKDSESNLHHDLHMLFNCLALVAFRIRGIGVDDRHKVITD